MLYLTIYGPGLKTSQTVDPLFEHNIPDDIPADLDEEEEAPPAEESPATSKQTE